MRVGGLALIGVGAVAALIGLATLLPSGGPDTGTNSAAPASTVTPAPSTDTIAAAPTGTLAGPAFATPTDNIGAPAAAGGTVAGTGDTGTGTGGPAAGGPVAGGSGSGRSVTAGVPATGGSAGGGAGTAVHAPLRVYNNSTITGLAARAADDFRTNGWPVNAVSNYPYGTISTSTVYYRPGTAEQAAATTLGTAFGLRVQQRFTGLDDATPGVIVIVTNDYQRR